MRYTHKQHFAYYLAKKNIFDAVSNKKLVTVSEQRGHFVGELEKEALQKAETLDNELCAIADSGIQIVFLGEKGYPKALENLEDAPVLLFVRSKTDAEELFNGNGREFVTVTGTRDPDFYGLVMTERVVERQAAKDVVSVIVSGLAVGIDSKAHETALREDIPTIAVLPSGVDNIYPHRNKALAKNTADTEGCALVWPFVKDNPVETAGFIHRNHILAGLGNATILVESRTHGGGIITAKIAKSYGRDVYAVPGRIGDVRSEGCNKLIREGIAKLW